MTEQQIVPIATASLRLQDTIRVDAPRATEGSRPKQTSAADGNILPFQAPANGASMPSDQGQMLEPKEVEEAVNNLNDYMQTIRRNLQFSVDKQSGRTVITVTDAETDKVVRQIPADETLALARRLKELGDGEDQGLILHMQT